AALAEVGSQPVQAVQQREVHGGAPAGSRLLGGDERRLTGKQRRRQARAAREDLGTLGAARRAHATLEELHGDAQREVALELAATRAQDLELGDDGELARGPQQARLPQARLAFDDHDRAAAAGGLVDRLADARKLGVALEESRCGFCRSTHASFPRLCPSRATTSSPVTANPGGSTQGSN